MSNNIKKTTIDSIPITNEMEIKKFIDIVKRTTDVDVESNPKTELEVNSMKLDIPIIMLKYNKVLLKIDMEVIELEDEYDKTYSDLYNQYKLGELRGKKLNRFYEDREIKNLVPKDVELLKTSKKKRILEALRKFTVNTLDELKTKSFALNNYVPIDLYDH